jgi:peroxiredoxin
MHREKMISRSVLCAILILVGSTLPAQQAEPALERVAPAAFDSPFPTGTFKNLNLAGGPESINLSASLGKRPVIIFYWIAGNPRADEILVQVQELVKEIGKDKITLYAAVLRRPGRGTEVVTQGIAKLGLEVPILDDDGFRLGQQLRVQSVPNVTIIDAAGKLRLTSGASLAQVLEYKFTLKDAIERVAKTGKLHTYGYLERYYPVNELVGQACPDFKAPLLSNRVEHRWSSMMEAEKMNVLIFWSVDCPHCRRSLPEINAWLKKNSSGINVISAAKITSQESIARTKEFCDLNDFKFRTLIDQDLQISRLYNVTTTPTIVIIGPDGVIDSVLLSGETDVGQALEARKRELLNAKS